MVVSAIATALGDFTTQLKIFNETKKLEIKKMHFLDKRKTYLNLIEQFSPNPDKPPNNKARDKALRIFRRELMMWGSAESIKAMAEFEEFGNNNPTAGIEFFIPYEKLLRAIRKDLGHDDTNLSKTYLAGIFLDKAGKQEIKNLFEGK